MLFTQFIKNFFVEVRTVRTSKRRKNFNDYICKEWDNRVQNRQGEVSKEDIQTVEDFIDIEDSQ